MAERSFFFDGVDLQYNSQDFARLFDMFFDTGVAKGYLNELKVSASKNNMITSVSTGAATVVGRGYVNDEILDITHDAAHATLDRIDRVVVQLNLATREVSILVKKGTPAAEPIPPSLQQDNIYNSGMIYELALAQVRVIKGKSFIDSSQLSDERPLIRFAGRTVIPYLFTGTNGDYDVQPATDTAVFMNRTLQNEGGWVQDNNKFIVPETGKYHIDLYAAFASISPGAEIQLSVFIYDANNMFRTKALVDTRTSSADYRWTIATGGITMHVNKNEKIALVVKQDDSGWRKMKDSRLVVTNII